MYSLSVDGATGNAGFTVSIGTLSLIDTGTLSMNTDNRYYFEGSVVIKTLGSSGTVGRSVHGVAGTLSGNYFSPINDMYGSLDDGTFNTTVSNEVDATVYVTSPTGTNDFQLDNFVVWISD